MDFSDHHFHVLRIGIHQVRAFGDEPDHAFNEAFRVFLEKKSTDGVFKHELSAFTGLMLEQAFFISAFADYGIHSNRGFFPEIYRRIKHKLLPPNLPDNELSLFITFLFDQKQDVLWLKKISYENWERLFAMIDPDVVTLHADKITRQLHNAIVVMSHRLTTIGIDPYMVSKLPEADDEDSPFFELNHAVTLFVKKHLESEHAEVDYQELQAVLQLIEHCEKLFADVQARKDETGTSLHLTFLLKRAQQHIDRIRLLLNLYLTRQHSNRVMSVSRLVTELVEAEHSKNSVRRFISDNTALLAYRIVSHTSEKGEHYIGFSRSENRKLLFSAMGGGIVVIFLVYIKHLIHELHLSLFFEGLLFGLNYGLGFVLMHLLHLTLATKQPAMTASYIAASIEQGDASVSKPWEVFRQIIRSQFVSLIGNLIVVLPVCFFLAYLMRVYVGHPVFNEQTARNHMYSNHPFYSASLVYAFFTGIFLALSGLITGYFDNKVVFSEIPARIIKHPVLSKTHGYARRVKLARFVERNLGAIIGNMALGLCLGMAGNLGKFIGLPFDIRHITISAGNFGIAVGSVPTLGWPLIITVFIGVLLIGIVNILSSFLISFVVACRSRVLSPGQSLRILLPFLRRR